MPKKKAEEMSGKASEKTAGSADDDAAQAKKPPAKKSKPRARKKKPPLTETEEVTVTELETLVIGSRLLIQDVTEFKETLCKYSEGQGTVTIDASELESVDTAGLQLLTAFTNSLQAQSRSIEWQKPSAALLEIAELVDLVKALDLPAASAADEEDESVVPPVEAAEEEDDGLLPVF